MSVALLTQFPYFPFNICRRYHDILCFFPILVICVFFSIFLLVLPQVSILSIFSKNQLLVLLLFSTFLFLCCFIVFSFIDFCSFIMCSLLVALSLLFCSSISSFCRWKLRSLVCDFPCFLKSIQCQKVAFQHCFSWVPQILICSIFFHFP